MYTHMIEFYGKRIKSYNIYIYIHTHNMCIKTKKKRGGRKRYTTLLCDVCNIIFRVIHFGKWNSSDFKRQDTLY